MKAFLSHAVNQNWGLSLSICLDAIKDLLLNIFTLIETIDMPE